MQTSLLSDAHWPFLSNRQVIVCGSMAHYAYLAEVGEELRTLGVRAVVPKADPIAHETMSTDQYNAYKRALSYAHLRKVRDPRTFAVLAVNLDRHGIPGYLGPNTFAEIAVAFAHSKRVFLIQEPPEMYEEELSAWGAVTLYGDLERIAKTYRDHCSMEYAQPSLFSKD